MKTFWNKGYNKFTHPSVLKISQALAAKPQSNFYFWQLKNTKDYAPFKKNEKLAELIGVVLGDGHIEKFPRTERLIVSGNSKNKGFIKRYKRLIKKIFKKEPLCMKSKNSNCIRISIYEKFISKRLNIITGNRKQLESEIPNWIIKNKKFLIAYLRGLYEAEGSFCVHKSTYTYKFLFANKNESLLKNVYRGLKILGFHPHSSKYKIQISKRDEVYRIKDLIRFRRY